MATPGASTIVTASTPAAQSDFPDPDVELDDVEDRDTTNLINHLNDAYQFKDADVILVSAQDGLHFRCHSFQLMAARCVLPPWRC